MRKVKYNPIMLEQQLQQTGLHHNEIARQLHLNPEDLHKLYTRDTTGSMTKKTAQEIRNNLQLTRAQRKAIFAK